MNLPNKLTVARICIIPLFMVFLLIPINLFSDGEFYCRIFAAVLFLAASITDHLDGKIARKYNLVTDFGKFLDPLADKMMVLGAMIGLTVLSGRGADAHTEASVYFRLTATLTFVVLFRELAVTSLRLAASGAKGVVIAANMLGKTKTVVQIVFVMTALLEPVIMGGRLLGRFSFFASIGEHHILSYVLMVLTAVMTIWSGLSYFKGYFPLINSNK